MHRIIKDFMIQAGDPTGTGRGGESIYGGKVSNLSFPTPSGPSQFTTACAPQNCTLKNQDSGSFDDHAKFAV